MDERVAHVRALVAERWRVARERCQWNDLQARRVEVLEHFFHGELLAKSASTSVEIAALKKAILDEAAAEEACREKLAARERERERIQTRVWASQRHVDHLKDALKDQQTELNAMWAEMISDREMLRDEDAARVEMVREAVREDEVIAQKLQQQLEELERAIATKKMESEKAKSSIESLKYRKRAVEGELEQANANNKSFHAKIAKLRGPKHAAVVEEGIDAILRELDEMGAP